MGKKDTDVIKAYLEMWREELGQISREIEEQLGHPPPVPAEKILAEKRAKIEAILRDGLDVGGIVEYTIPVAFVYSDWLGDFAFKGKNGRLHPAHRHLR